MSTTWYNQGVSSDNLDWNADTLKTLLLKGGSYVSKDHDTVAAVVAGAGSSAGIECDATNYARQTLASKTVTVDDTGDTSDYDAADTTYSGLGGTTDNDIIGEVIYKDVDGTDANAVPLLFVGFGGGAITAVDTTGETFTIAGDQTALFSNGDTFHVIGSTGNDGSWTVSSSTLSGGDTVITVTGDITDATADGTIHKTISTDGNNFTINYAAPLADIAT